MTTYVEPNVYYNQLSLPYLIVYAYLRAPLLNIMKN